MPPAEGGCSLWRSMPAWYAVGDSGSIPDANSLAYDPLLMFQCDRLVGAFSLTRKAGCPFQARLFGLVTGVTGRLGTPTFQATLAGHSRRAVASSVPGTCPMGTTTATPAATPLRRSGLSRKSKHGTGCPALGIRRPATACAALWRAFGVS